MRLHPGAGPLHAAQKGPLGQESASVVLTSTPDLASPLSGPQIHGLNESGLGGLPPCSPSLLRGHAGSRVPTPAPATGKSHT